MSLINNKLLVEFKEPETKPLLIVHRFRVHRVVHQHFMDDAKGVKQLKLRVFGLSHEVFEIRVYFDDEGIIDSVRAYHYQGCDGEMVEYVVKAIVQWLCRKKSKYKKVEYKSIELWRKG